ncbi:alpha/beta fold hydrolase [Streptomyces cyaneofuscatus]|uniref:alpha/beta fold hydrolase n=1 Tax=Streptomyces cyaneofuscatus TaxID=66883 RepID=UPI0013DD000C|nr:alpha/beta fold hydrolase [Streptomyces cyaneofuscatus]NDZ66528.1 alpha/beta fold hydrolase [Streptomyces cyaneofuscatus]
MTSTHETAPPSTTPLTAPLARTVRGSGPGLLLAHGAGGGIEANYGPILDGLAARHTVVGVDYPGAGASPRSLAPLDVDTLADELVAAADAEGVERFAVSGYSLGGPVAIRVAARHPERVDALVLSATFAYADTRTDLVASVWRQLLAVDDPRLLGEFVQLMALGEGALNTLTPDEIRAGAELITATVPPGTGDQVDLVRRIDVREDLAGITVPALVIVTADDPLVSPTLQRALAAGLPGSETAELPTGHLPFAERPQEWLALITGFLARHRKAGRA